MSGRLISVLAIGLLLGMDSSRAADPPQGAADQAAESGKPTRFATVKIVAILKEVAKPDLKALQVEHDERERRLKEGESELLESAKRLEKTPPESPEYKKLEEDFASFRAAGEVSTPKGKRLVDRQAAIYARHYLEVQEEIDTYCSANGIGLVLDDDSPECSTTRDDPDWVVRNMAKRLVFVGPEVDDITAEILRRVSERHARQEESVIRSSKPTDLDAIP